jgi:hypothetical protein
MDLRAEEGSGAGAAVSGLSELTLAEERPVWVEIGQREARQLPASLPVTMVSTLPQVVSPVTWPGRTFRRKQTRHSRSRRGTAFRVRSALRHGAFGVLLAQSGGRLQPLETW